MTREKTRVWCVCPVCGKRFSVCADDYKRRMKASKSGALYHSKECQYIARRKVVVDG